MRPERPCTQSGPEDTARTFPESHFMTPTRVSRESQGTAAEKIMTLIGREKDSKHGMKLIPVISWIVK
jgi:hypothetical protein